MAVVLDIVDNVEDWEEIAEDMEMLVENHRRRYIRDLENPMEFYGEDDFRRRYRFSKIVVTELIEVFIEDLRSVDRRGLPVPPILQLLTALRYYATGNFQLVAADLVGISQSTVSRVIKKTSILIARLFPRYVSMPDAEGARRNAVAFYAKARFPGVLGCIDGTHIPIKGPGGEYGEIFRNRKGLFSFNCQAIVGPNHNFINFVTGWPGSVHDNTIFLRSAVCAVLQRREFREVLLGDSGYACQPYLMTPLLNPTTEAERRYNNSHISTRNIVERTFGIWKKRFPCLLRRMNFKLESMTTVITATVVLHNIAVREGIVDEVIPLLAEVEEFHQDDGVLGAAARRALIERHFT